VVDFPRAIPVPRGCGVREPGGVYLECGLSKNGRPLEEFLVDPPLPPPEGKGKEELANKPQLWVRTARTDPDDPATDYVVMHPGTEQPIVDILIWIGAEHYPHVCDCIEEGRRYGFSRKLNPNLDLSQLTRYSRMILLHPYALNTLWDQQQPPLYCGKSVPGHASFHEEWGDDDGPQTDEWVGALDERSSVLHTGPCLWKCYDLIPGQDPVPPGVSRPMGLRSVGSTDYPYHPTGESREGLRPGIFATLPITGFALIQFDDGTVNERAKSKIVGAMEQNGEFALPWYETPE
jgi:hypothetical protein